MKNSAANRFSNRTLSPHNILFIAFGCGQPPLPFPAFVQQLRRLFPSFPLLQRRTAAIQRRNLSQFACCTKQKVTVLENAVTEQLRHRTGRKRANGRASLHAN